MPSFGARLSIYRNPPLGVRNVPTRKYREGCTMDFDLADFKDTPLGTKVGAVLTSPENVMRMIALSNRGIPAVEAVGKALLEVDDRVSTNDVKRLVGLWVREVMRSTGWVPAGVAGVKSGNLFASGALFTRKTTG
jgi:hypothetical protein